MPIVLLVDDEAAIQHAFQRAFRSAEITIRTASTAAEAIEAIRREPPDAILLDVHLPDASGLETYERIRQIDSRVPVIMITGHGTTDLAIEAMKAGAFDFLLKPLELNDVRDAIDKAVRSNAFMRRPATISDVESTAVDGDLLVGRCPAMQDVYKAIGRVAATDTTVLILGESGTGKELVARAIYQHSLRVNRPFVAINCGAIPESLIESELFGHEKGAFTGADRKRIGKFEQAAGGTIFLDEVGELPLSAQVKMLRVLQEQRFERVGGNETVITDVRILAATNQDLNRAVVDGHFRKDLYFRLNVFNISLPPLSARGADLPRLVEHYVRAFAIELSRPVLVVSDEAMAALTAYPWPGNVRELQSILKQAMLQSRGEVLLADFLPAQVFQRPGAMPATGAPSGLFDWDAFVQERLSAGSETLYAEGLARMEREVLMRVLQHTAGNQLQAAKLLGITRGSLRNKIRTHGINIGRDIWSDDDHADL